MSRSAWRAVRPPSGPVEPIVQGRVEAPQPTGGGMHGAPARAGLREQALVARAPDLGMPLVAGGVRGPNPRPRDHLVARPRRMLVVDLVPQHDPRDARALRGPRGRLPIRRGDVLNPAQLSHVVDG